MGTVSHAGKSAVRFTNTNANPSACRTSNGEAMRVLGLKNIEYALRDIVENLDLVIIYLFAFNFICKHIKNLRGNKLTDFA